MRTFYLTIVITLLNIVFAYVPVYGQTAHLKENIHWNEIGCLPPINNLPNKGVAGAYSGFVGDHLVVMGGANFPDKAPWLGGKKQWWDTAYAINVKDSTSQWKILDHLMPSALGYGVSIQLPEGLLCVGGCDSVACSSKVFLITEQYGEFVTDFNWPSLPVPLAHATGSLINDKIYVAGGQSSMVHPESTKHFFVLDLMHKEKGWQELASWPGPARAFAVSVNQNDGFDNCFYLFSGREYYADGTLHILSDGYVYNPRLDSWLKLEGEFPVMAGTAIHQGTNHILFLGGSSEMIPGSDSHPGFSTVVRSYHTITQKLDSLTSSPYPLAVTTNIACKDGVNYITSGEIKPGVRTPSIITFKMMPYEKGLSLINILVIAAYFLVLIWMGYYFSKKQKNTDDYFKGGSRIPWWAVGLSIFGTSLSAITFMSIPAKAYATDWSYMMVNAGILMVVPVIMYVFIPFFRKMNITTAYEYLDGRFNTVIRSFCSISFILFQIGRIGIVLYLPAIALNVVTGIDIVLCICLMGILSLAYTMVGGIEAVVWTEALQVVVLLGGAFLSIILIACNVDGGIGGIVAEGSAMNKFCMGSMDFDLQQSTLWTVLIASFFTNLTTYGTDQTMVQRYMTTKTEKQAKKSLLTNAVLTVPATLIFFFVGTALFVFFKQHPADLSMTLTDRDAIFPWYIYSQFPQGLTGLLISGILAAAMSTLSSSMNSAATAYVIDIHKHILKRNASLNTAKFATAVLGTLGIAFALMMVSWDISSLWDEFNKILGLILGSMGGLFLLGMLTERANSSGAIIGIIGSILVQLYFVNTQSVHLLLYTATGVISCFVIGYLSSFLFSTPDKDIKQFTIYKS